MNLEIESNTRVTLNFSLTLETGEEVDSNFGAKPVSFVMEMAHYCRASSVDYWGCDPATRPSFGFRLTKGLERHRMTTFNPYRERILTAMRRWSPACCSVC